MPEVNRLLGWVLFLASSLPDLALLGFLLRVKSWEPGTSLWVHIRWIEFFILPIVTVLLALSSLLFNHLDFWQHLLVNRQQLLGSFLSQRNGIFQVVVNALFCLVLAHRKLRDVVLFFQNLPRTLIAIVNEEIGRFWVILTTLRKPLWALSWLGGFRMVKGFYFVWESCWVVGLVIYSFGIISTHWYAIPNDEMG